MKKIQLILLIVLLLGGCKKENATAKTVQVKVIRNNCVQIILSALNNGSIGENWTDAFRNIHTNCFNVGTNSNIKIDSVNQILTVELTPADSPFIGICLMADIKGTNSFYNVIQK